MPEDTPENPDQTEAPKRTVLQTIWLYHPFAMLIMALIIAIFAYSLLPQEVKEEPKTIDYFYNRSIEALKQAKNPLVSASKGAVQVAIQKAKTDMEYIFTHKSYLDQLSNRPDLINPYMLFGESLYLYASHPNISQNNQKNYKMAATIYSKAIGWEGKHWSERQQRIYDKQYFNNDEPYNDRVLTARKLLRKQYLKYMHAICAMKAGQYNLAAESIDNLMQEFRLESLRLSDSQDSMQTDLSKLPPHEFELLPEDRNLLYFQLAQLNDIRGNYTEAEKNYQIFLLRARRSREYFQALMRLGMFYFMDAKNEEDNISKRRLYSEAANIFNKVVTSSPPGDILREAYFTGGQAYLNMALTLPVTKKTIWNRLENLGEAVNHRLQSFAKQNKLPERNQAIVSALGRMVAQSALSTPAPGMLSLKSTLGSGLSLSQKERLTPLGERKRLLSRAKAFFTGSQGGEAQKYNGASYIMLARTYMVEQDFEKARGLLRYTSSKFWSNNVELACQLGIANSYLLEKKLDRAYVRFIGGVEKTTPSLLVEYDIKSWPQLCSQIHQGSTNEKPNPGKRIWAMLPENIQEIIYNATMTGRLPKRYQPIIVRRLNELLSREDFYSPDYFKDLELKETAYRLLEEELPLLTLKNRQWLNRMLLEAAFRSSILPTEDGKIYKPFISAKDLNKDADNVLLSKEHIVTSLKQLSLEYVNRANHFANENDLLLESGIKINEEKMRLLAAAPRRELEHASKVNKFLISQYPSDENGDIMLENASILIRRARLAGGEPFHNTKLAKELVSEAANAYFEIGQSGKYLQLEQEALLEAGRNFYASGQYGRASEALMRFVQNYPDSSKIGWARNLLGRCYWYQGRFIDAAKIYRDNSKRRTPDGRDSLYYLGAVYLDAGETTIDQTTTDRIGDPEKPYAQMDKNGDYHMTTALQVFNEVRRTPGITPSSRPWRWATFGIAKTWYDIAEQARAQELDKAEKEKRPAASIKWVPYYEEAEKLLRESLDRYRLKYSPTDPVGVDKEEEPEDYNDIMRERMESEYFLAMALKVLARTRTEMGEEEVRKRLAHVINPELYPNEMTDLNSARLLLTTRSVLGLTEGPVVRPRYLDTLRHNAFFLLAQSWKDYGRKLLKENKKSQANKAFDKALQIYRQARDRLNLQDGPRILYNMGETMISLGKPQDAKRLFLMAINQVSQLESAEQKPEAIEQLLIWRTLSQDRIKDMDNKVGF